MDKTRIRQLNDQLRCHGTGGQIVVTRGVLSLGRVVVDSIVREVRAFDRFDASNDPHGEHDCAVVRAGDVEVIFKIDYYERDGDCGSPDPADPAVTHRVMTIMLREEY